MSLLAISLVPLLTPMLDSIPGRVKTFVCTDPQTHAISINQQDVKRAKLLDDTGLYQLTPKYGPKRIVKTDPSHDCRLIK